MTMSFSSRRCAGRQTPAFTSAIRGWPSQKIVEREYSCLYFSHCNIWNGKCWVIVNTALDTGDARHSKQKKMRFCYVSSRPPVSRPIPRPASSTVGCVVANDSSRMGACWPCCNF